jgi:hypothetical protein
MIEKENLKNFKEKYPELDPYFINFRKTGVFPKRHLESPDTYFCTGFISLLFLIFNVISIFLRRDLNENYYMS